MSKKTLACILLPILLVIGSVNQSWTVTATAVDWVPTSVEQGDCEVEAPDSHERQQKNSGGGFMRALGAPFRAIGRLFSGKKSDQQARRTTEKDAAKFEATKVVRVKDAKEEPPSTAKEQPEQASVEISSFGYHLENGRRFLLTGNLDSAIAELTAAQSLKPKSAAVNNLLGIAFESKGLRERALQAFAVAVKSDEKNGEYLNNYGFLLFKNKDYEGATKYLKRATKLAPKEARVWNNLALAQCQQGKFDDAYESFVKAGGEIDGHVNIAAQLQSHGYAKDAIKHLESAQALRPNSIDLLTKLVALYETTGRLTDAEAARRSLVALKTLADANK